MNNKRKISIFIVEDNKLFNIALIKDIEESFKGFPLKICSFENGEACMDQFKEEKPDVVILDFHLNSKNKDAADGVRVLDWIKKENKETNVIILTSDDSIDIALKSLKHGASDYIVKTETKFRKINYSLLNIFKMINAKGSAKLYERMAMALSVAVVLLVGGVIALAIFSPGLIK